MLNILEIPITQIIQFLNLGFIAIIVICAIVGFIRGALKSSYYMIVTLLIYILGLIFMRPIVNSLIYTDVSFLNGLINTDIVIETPMQFVSQVILQNNPDYAFLFTEGSYSLTLVEGVVGMVLGLVYFILLIILSFTLFKIISGIVWLILKKPLRKKFAKPVGQKKNGKPKYKKNIKSRSIGLGIGAVKGILYTLLIGFIIAGLASASTSLKTIASEDNEVAVICIDDTFTVVELMEGSDEYEEDNQGGLGEYNELFELFEGYRKTVPGKVYGCIKFGEYDTTIDEALFDAIFNIKGENGSIRIRSELKKLAKALSNEAVKEIMSDGFDIKKLHELNEEDLKELVDTLSELDLVKVVIPVGLEFITYSDALSEMLGDQNEDFQKILEEKLPELLKIDYCQEVKSLGYVFVDVIDLLGNDIVDLSKMDFFNLDQKTLNDIFDGLGNMKLLEVVAPITINYLLNTEAVKKAIEEAGFTLEDLGLTQDIDYVAELMNLPNIYEKVVAVGLKRVDGKISFSEVDYTKVEPLVEALFTSVIIKNAVPVVATTLTKTYLPDDYKGILPEEELKTVDWENEFGPVLTAVALLLKTGILDSDQPMQALLDLNDKDFEELGLYLSKSQLLCNNMNELLDVLLQSMDFKEVEFIGLDSSKGEYWNETEIVSLFKAIKKIATGLNKELTDLEIEELAISISSSKYIKKNLNNLINSLTRDLGFKLAELSDEEWTVNEIFTVFKSINIISSLSDGGGIKIESFLKLSDENLSIVLESKLIKESLKKIIVDRSQPGGDLQLLKGVYEDGIDLNGNIVYSWDDVVIDVNSTISGSTLSITPNNDVVRYIVYKNNRFFTTTIDNLNVNLNKDEYTYSSSDEFYVKGITQNGELRNVFNAIAALDIENISSFDIDLRKVVNKKDVLFDSYILTETIVYEIRKYDKDTNANGVLTIPFEYKEGGTGDWHGEDGELNNIIISLDALLTISQSEQPVYITQLTDKINNVYIENIYEGIDDILLSKIITFTVIDEIKKLNGNGVNIPEIYMSELEPWLNVYDSNKNKIKDGEISRFMSGVYTSMNLSSETKTPVKSIDVNTISLNHMVNDHIIDDVLYSDVLTLTIKNKVLSYSEGSNPTLYIPVNYDVPTSKNYIIWKNTYDSNGVVVTHGELNHFFEGLHYILDGDATLDNMDSLSYTGVFETEMNSEGVIPQDEVLKSKVISETILKKIVSENSEAISVPSGVGLDNEYDRSKWYNEYNTNDILVRKNELAKLIDALGLMVDADQMTHLQDFDMYSLIDNVLPLFKNDETLTIILKSYVASETIKNKVSTVKSFKDESVDKDYVTIAFNNYGKNPNNSDEWYAMDSNGNPLEKELWHLLKGSSILLGDQSLSNLDNISMEILINNPDIVPTYDENCNITSNEIEVMLKSIVLEESFVNVSKNMLTNGGYLSMVIDVPSDVNWYKKDVTGSEEYDLLTFLQSFYIIQDLFDYQNNKDILNTVDAISHLDDDGINKLATGMVISRMFRSNIEKMMNTIFAPAYGLKYLQNPSAIKPWDSVKFVQADYNGNSKIQAKNKFVSAYKVMCTEINK